jgi:ABC-2 type transport system permease protein
LTTLVGTGRLIRLILRRDRVRLSVWIIVLAGFPVFTASALVELYATEASRTQLIATFGSNPAYVALLGPIYDSSVGALTAWRIGTVGALLVGLMAALTVIRHTRDEEEAGRRELLGATVVGRHAPLTAALLVIIGAALLIGLLIAAGLISLDLPTSGAIAYGLGFAAVAAAFAMVGGAAAQITEGGGAARGLAVGFLGLAFMLRAAGDAGEVEALGWLSPLGWFARLRPFAGERWWVLALSAALALFFGTITYIISSRRDIGGGAFPPRLGPASAAEALRSPLGLAWRLQRTALLEWSVGLAMVAALYGSVANSVDELLTDNPQLAELLEGLGGEQRLTDAFFSLTTGILALIAAAYSISTALRLRIEEDGSRAEPVLATATPRARWMGSHLVFALLGPALMLTVAGLVMGATYGAAIGDVGGQLPRALRAALIQLPAVWVLTGATAALFGLMPRLTAVSWGALVTCLIFGQLGQILQFPQWMLNLSPFTHLAMAAGDVGVIPVVAVTVIAAALLASGFVGFHRRDLAAS